MDEQPVKKKLLSPEKVTIGAIVSFLFLIFGAIVVFSAQYGSDASSSNSSTATPAPEGLFQAGAQSNLSAKQPQQQVQGAKSEQMPVVQPTLPPTPEPTPAPTSTPAPTPSSSPTPSPSPSSSSSSDSEGPKISGITADAVENNRATIKFGLNEDADAKIEYGESTDYGKSKEESAKKSSHSIEISDLEANKTYHYRVISKDNAGNSTTSGDNTFTTKP